MFLVQCPSLANYHGATHPSTLKDQHIKLASYEFPVDTILRGQHTWAPFASVWISTVLLSPWSLSSWWSELQPKTLNVKYWVSHIVDSPLKNRSLNRSDYFTSTVENFPWVFAMIVLPKSSGSCSCHASQIGKIFLNIKKLNKTKNIYFINLLPSGNILSLGLL